MLGCVQLITQSLLRVQLLPEALDLCGLICPHILKFSDAALQFSTLKVQFSTFQLLVFKLGPQLFNLPIRISDGPLRLLFILTAHSLGFFFLLLQGGHPSFQVGILPLLLGQLRLQGP